jgi:hypothetical protein
MEMKNIIINRVIVSFGVTLALTALTSCENIFEPLDDNHSTFERVLQDPAFAEGLLTTGYSRLPTNSYSYNEAATDDAVSNDKLNVYLRMATGEWSSTFNPVGQWSNCLLGIQSVNHFLTIVDGINWRESIPAFNILYIKRLKGEAFGLRAMLKFYLLQSVAGETQSGEMAGIPLLDSYLQSNADFNIPRASFAESVENIYSDIEKSLNYLTMDDYGNVSSAAELPPGYGKEVVGIDPATGQAAYGNYNIVFGNESTQRISGRIVKTLRAKLALLAASPAYGNSQDLWEEAAVYAGGLVQSAGGVSGLDPEGHLFYTKAYTDRLNLAARKDRAEIIWRSPKTFSYELEQANFPPTLFGNGGINPSQNLVDAFPMLNGYPTHLPQSGYNGSNPYAGRDPRLSAYIIFNNSFFQGATIITGQGGKENAKDSIKTSTRTGYYLKKLLMEEVNLNPNGISSQEHYMMRLRYTDVFLMYAEAANEAWGPDGDQTGFGFTARDVVRAIRERAGISQPDAYLESIGDMRAMRALIHNERRIELCFEGHRFWDLRRWKEKIDEPVKGVDINASGYNYADVEQRAYRDFMYYGPVPQQEILKYNSLVQNKGW